MTPGGKVFCIVPWKKTTLPIESNMIFHVITNRIFALHFNLASNSEKSYIRKGSRIENIISIDVKSNEKVSALLFIYALYWSISNIQKTI